MAKSCGQIAYETWATLDGGTWPAWDDLGESMRLMWEAIALSVCKHAVDFLGQTGMPDVIDLAGGLRPAESMGAVYARAILAQAAGKRGK